MRGHEAYTSATHLQCQAGSLREHWGWDPGRRDYGMCRMGCAAHFGSGVEHMRVKAMNELKASDREGIDELNAAIDRLSKLAAKEQEETRAADKAVKKSRSSLLNSRALKRHLKYIVPEMRLALIKESGLKPQAITSADDLDRFIEPLKHYAEEHFVSFHLNAKLQVIGYQIVSRGTISATLVHPREVFKAALLANSYALIVAHNHPGGSLDPSREDIETTKTLIEAGEILGVRVIDHIIVSSNGSHSLRESNPHLWV